jgi:hypothetical protein
MDTKQAARLAIDPGVILEAQGFRPDPWQREYLFAEDRRIMLLCCRGAGKSRATSAKALHKAIHIPEFKILILCPGLRQAKELIRYIKEGYRALKELWKDAKIEPIGLIKDNEGEIELTNHSRIVALPSKEATIRGYQGVGLLIKDEAAQIPDDLNRAVVPMLAISKGQEIDLSTPFGQRGFFWKKWHDPKFKGKKISVPWQKCPRHTPEFIEQERNENGSSWVAQEYEISFQSLTGLVYPDFEKLCGIDIEGPSIGHKMGGIDWGYQDPFVSLRGYYDPHQDDLVINREIYVREKALSEIAKDLDIDCEHEADPSQPSYIKELRMAGFTVRKAFNKIPPGIAAVKARMERGKLHIVRHKCPNTFEEAKMYQYPKEGGEVPIDKWNHAMDALRYLIARIDRGFISRYLGKVNGQPAELGDDHPTSLASQKKREQEAKQNHPITSSIWDDESMWTIIT